MRNKKLTQTKIFGSGQIMGVANVDQFKGVYVHFLHNFSFTPVDLDVYAIDLDYIIKDVREWVQKEGLNLEAF